MSGTGRRPLVAAVVAGLLALAGCTAGPGADPAPRASAAPSPAARFSSYVALGDSYTAAPLVPMTDLADGCLRSNANYPSLLARRLGVRHFTDVSCSAATTGDLVHRQTTYRTASVPPQLRAVHRGTDLVTVGIGGNDFDLFGTLAYTCTRLRATDPAGDPCRRSVTGSTDLARTTAEISDAVAHSLRLVQARAPHATVVLVGYLRLVPDHGHCAQLPLATGDYAFGRQVSRALDEALARAARRTHVRYLDAYALSAGHDVCSAHPWVNGSHSDRRRAAAYHPLAAGERAVAARLASLLSKGTS